VSRLSRVTDAHGHSWRIGTDADVAWINDGTSASLAITAAIPPVFEAYATVVIPDGAPELERYNQAVLTLLEAAAAVRPWWLGYLVTSPDHRVMPGVTMAALPTVTMYPGWPYILVQAGPRQAAAWRRSDSPAWRHALPDLMFPADQSWLASTLCDDDWTCLGGPAGLVAGFLAEPALQARPARPRDDATPPGHQAR
jgi:hypothetical protein